MQRVSSKKKKHGRYEFVRIHCIGLQLEGHGQELHAPHGYYKTEKKPQKSSRYRFLKPPAVLAYCFPLWMGLTGCSLQNWNFVAKGDNPERKSWFSSVRIGRKASYRMGYFYQTFGNISFAIHTLHNHYSFNRIYKGWIKSSGNSSIVLKLLYYLR